MRLAVLCLYTSINVHRGLRQHALLNLVRMHYMHREYDAARKVSVLRAPGDLQCELCSCYRKLLLFQGQVAIESHSKTVLGVSFWRPLWLPSSRFLSFSMLHRLPSSSSKQRTMPNEIQPDLHPLEVFYDVGKLSDVCTEDHPLSE